MAADTDDGVVAPLLDPAEPGDVAAVAVVVVGEGEESVASEFPSVFAALAASASTDNCGFASDMAQIAFSFCLFRLFCLFCRLSSSPSE